MNGTMKLSEEWWNKQEECLQKVLNSSGVGWGGGGDITRPDIGTLAPGNPARKCVMYGLHCDPSVECLCYKLIMLRDCDLFNE